MNSFQPICKVIEDLAILDEHCKARRDQVHQIVGSSRESLESAGPKIPTGLNAHPNLQYPVSIVNNMNSISASMSSNQPCCPLQLLSPRSNMKNMNGNNK